MVTKKKTIVVGLGNPFLTDDGVGVKVARELAGVSARQSPVAVAGDLPVEFVRPDGTVTITEASVGGLRLMELMIGYDRVIIIDALTVCNGKGVGTIHRLTLDDLATMSPTRHSASAHDTTLVTALDSGRRLGFQLPEELVIYAVEVENVLDFSEEPTATVAAAIPAVVAAVLSELDCVSPLETRPFSLDSPPNAT